MSKGGCSDSQCLKTQVPESERRNMPSEITNGEANTSMIFRVPEQYIRADNVHSFHPEILSIGPYHHGSSGLEGMESIKLTCLRSILGCISEDYYGRAEIVRLANNARSFYSDNITMEPNNFPKMLLLDGCFILSALTGMQGRDVENVPSENAMSSQGTTSSDTRGHRGRGQGQGDLNQHEPLHRHAIAHDLLLIENQIPFFVIKKIHELAVQSATGEATESPNQRIAEFVEGVLQQYPKAIGSSEIGSNDFHHLLHLCHMFFQPSLNPVDHHRNQAVMNQWHRAMQYCEAGVEFRVKDSSTPHSLLDVTFSNGIMEIPHLSIDAKTESIFSNLIMFEHGYPRAGKYINAYVTFMSQLLSSVDDVELLVQIGIIEILGSKEEVLNIFSKLNGLAVSDPRGENYYLKSTLQSVEAHYHRRLNWWMAWLKHNHFRNPCLAIAALVGFITLLCTLTQGFFAVFQYFKPRN